MGLACSAGNYRLRASCQPTGTVLYVAPELTALRERGVVMLDDPYMLESSETYSLACSIRDMFWTCRKMLPVVKRRIKSCFGQDKLAARMKFIRGPGFVLNDACHWKIMRDLKSLGIPDQNITKIRIYLNQLDGIILDTISSQWDARPPIQALQSVLRNIYANITAPPMTHSQDNTAGHS